MLGARYIYGHPRMKRKRERFLRMKCHSCSFWNRVKVNKIFIEVPSPDPKVKVLVPMYEPLEVSKCKKCGKVISEPNVLIRIRKSSYS